MCKLQECLPSGTVRTCDRVTRSFGTYAECVSWLKAEGFKQIREGGEVWAKLYCGEWQQPFKIVS